MKKLLGVLGFLGGVFTSGVVMAAGVSDGMNFPDMAGYLAPIAAGIAIGLAAFGATYSLGKASSAALEGITRNPSSASKVFGPLLLSLALIEFQGILGFIIAIMLVLKK